MYVCTYVCTYVRMYVCTCVRTYVRTYVTRSSTIYAGPVWLLLWLKVRAPKQLQELAEPFLLSSPSHHPFSLAAMVHVLHVRHCLLLLALAPSLGAATDDDMEIDFASRLGKVRPWAWPPIFRLGSGAGNEMIGSPQAPGIGSKPLNRMRPKAYSKEYVPGPKPKEKKVMVDSRSIERMFSFCVS